MNPEVPTAAGAQSDIDYLVVGHLSVDRIDGSTRPGGSVLYAAAAAAALGQTVAAVSVAGDEFDWPATLPQPLRSRVHWHIRPCGRSTGFVNVYAADGRRSQVVTHRAPPLEAMDIPEAWRRPRVAHVAPVGQEIPDDMLATVEAPLVGITSQGWLRRLTEGRPVEPGRWSPPGSALVSRARVIVVSDEDLRGEPRGYRALVEGFVAEQGADVDRSRLDPGQSSAVSSAPGVRSPGKVIVVTRGRGGAVAYADGAQLTQAAIGAQEVDLTGAGDTFATALLVRLAEGGDLEAAMAFAAAAASLGIEVPGPGGVGSRLEVRRRLEAGGARNGG